MQQLKIEEDVVALLSKNFDVSLKKLKRYLDLTT